VPVLQRLRERKRLTTVLVDESKPAIYTVYAKTADVTFPLRRLMGEGRTYVRARRGLLDRMGLSLVRPARRVADALAPAAKAPIKGAAATGGAPATTPSNVPANGTTTADAAGFELAVEKVVAVAARNGGQSTGRQSVTKELRVVPGFSSNGTTRYFGHGSYDGLVRAVAEHDKRVVVRPEKGGGMSLVFVGAPAVPPSTVKPSSAAAAPA
jgi:hypothetical protein